ncbi:MAG TPA: hypothetical protein VM925_00760 [Labilithrix sp.]|nr:hypothetical protein [Labilithrix sp.]
MIRPTNRPAVHAREAEAAAVAALRADLRGLVALELVQRVLGLGVLVVVAVRAVVVTDDHNVAVALTLAAMTSFVFLALAFRLRRGQELVRDDLRRMELRAHAEHTHLAWPCERSPYRALSCPGDQTDCSSAIGERRSTRPLLHLSIACVLFAAGPFVFQRLVEAGVGAAESRSPDQRAAPSDHLRVYGDPEWIEDFERTWAQEPEEDADRARRARSRQ